jgi:hypothetical protein
LIVLPLSILCAESCLLVSWCVGDRCGMTASDKNRDKSRRHGVEIGNDQAQVEYSVAV